MTSFSDIIAAARAAGPRRYVVAQAADPTILEALDEARKLGFAVVTLRAQWRGRSVLVAVEMAQSKWPNHGARRRQGLDGEFST